MLLTAASILLNILNVSLALYKSENSKNRCETSTALESIKGIIKQCKKIAKVVEVSLSPMIHGTLTQVTQHDGFLTKKTYKVRCI